MGSACFEVQTNNNDNPLKQKNITTTPKFNMHNTHKIDNFFFGSWYYFWERKVHPV